jgi:N-acyl-D-aspartate/D-glutamate deacylase
MSTGGIPMRKEFDLVVRNGTVVDGTGGPLHEADVAVKGGRIAAVGKIAGSGAEEIDAKGRLVTPGFVDIHTHYDGQAVWDPYTAPSSWHGVTTAVMGNCGVGFAPCKPQDREKLVELMEGVEDIPSPVMHEGLKWTWESFAEYFQSLESKQRDIDLCALLPHAAVRVYVMGDRAIRHEKATEADIGQMRVIARDAIKAGAFGFSTSRTISHKSLTGEYTPTLRANEDELAGIAMGLRDAGSGFIEFVSDWTEPDTKSEFDMLRRVAERSGRPVVFSVSRRHEPHRRDQWKELVAYADQAQNDGVNIRAVTAPRAVGVLLGLEGSQNPFSGTPTYKSIAKLPLPERVARMRDPEVRRNILSEDPVAGATFPLIRRLQYTHMYRFGNPANYLPKAEDSIAAMAAKMGVTPPELAYDILLEDEGHSFIHCPISNYPNYSLDGTEQMLANRNVIMGLGDGGAHVGFILDAGYPTWLLTYWGRQKKRWPVEELVRRLTSDTAAAAGLGDRGVIAVGKKADLNVIDYAGLEAGRPYVTYDLPAGGRRLMQKVRGYEATIVSGTLTYRNGEATGALPGRMVKGQRAPQAMAAE